MTGRARSLLDSYRGPGNLIDRAKSAAANLLNPAAQQTQAPPAVDAPRVDPLTATCTTIAQRDLDLIDNLLAQLERLEAAERDPDTLATLYGLDHLATRLRRNAEALRVLAGTDGDCGADPKHEAMPLLDVIRAALASIERYPRVTVGRVAALAVVGTAADDVSRILAELLDNATAQSPPKCTVVVSAHLTEKGSVLIRVEDEGVSLADQELAALNERLATETPGGGLGLAVVRRLAGAHAIEVRLARRSPHGMTASALLPTDLVCESPTPVPLAAVVRTTASGLPRRIPRKGRTRELSVVEPIPAAREEFVTDLAAFTEGVSDAHGEGDDVVGE